MSNDLINIRFGGRHFHIMRDFPFFRTGRNPYHARGGWWRQEPGWKWFEVYLWP